MICRLYCCCPFIHDCIEVVVMSYNRHRGRDRSFSHRDRDRSARRDRDRGGRNSRGQSTFLHDDRNRRDYSPPPAVQNSFRDSFLEERRLKQEQDDKDVRSSNRVFSFKQEDNPQEGSSGLSRTVVFRDRSLSSNEENLQSRRISRNEDTSRDNEEGQDEEDFKDLAQELIKAGEKLHLVSEKLNSIIAKPGPDLDLIGKKSEERKKLLKSLKKLRSKVKKSYKKLSWTPVNPDIIRKHLQDLTCIHYDDFISVFMTFIDLTQFK